MLKSSPEFSANYAVIQPVNDEMFTVVGMAMCPYIDEQESAGYASSFASDMASLLHVNRKTLFPVAASLSWRIGQVLRLEELAGSFSKEQLVEWATKRFTDASDAFKDSPSASNYSVLERTMVVHQQARQIRDWNEFKSKLASAKLETAICLASCGLTIAEIQKM